MKAKTLKQISAQSTRIQFAIANSNLSDHDKLAKIGRVKQIASRYSNNMIAHLRNAMGWADIEEYGAITPFPLSMYARQAEV